MDRRSVEPERTSAKEGAERQLVEKQIDGVQHPASQPAVSGQAETGYTETQGQKGPQVREEA
jgi:hypothetical protein